MASSAAHSGPCVSDAHISKFHAPGAADLTESIDSLVGKLVTHPNLPLVQLGGPHGTDLVFHPSLGFLTKPDAIDEIESVLEPMDKQFDEGNCRLLKLLKQSKNQKLSFSGLQELTKRSGGSLSPNSPTAVLERNKKNGRKILRSVCSDTIGGLTMMVAAVLPMITNKPGAIVPPGQDSNRQNLRNLCL
jgi:hypothetical protein